MGDNNSRYSVDRGHPGRFEKFRDLTAEATGGHGRPSEGGPAPTIATPGSEADGGISPAQDGVYREPGETARIESEPRIIEELGFTIDPKPIVESEKIDRDRGESYGDFTDQCDMIARAKQAFNLEEVNLTPVQEECLNHIITKISRICNGDPNHMDSWTDISGYATLAVRHHTPPTYEL